MREMFEKYNQMDLVAKWQMNTEAEGEGRIWDHFQNSSALKENKTKQTKNPHTSFHNKKHRLKWH